MELEEAIQVQTTAVKFNIVGHRWPHFSISLDVYPEDTCTDVTDELLGYVAEGTDQPLRLHLYECWRGRERKVRKNEKVVNLVRQWGSPGDLKLVGRVLSNGSSRAKKKEKPPLDLRKLTELGNFNGKQYSTKTLVRMRDALKRMATMKQMELDSVMLERLKTRGPLWGPRDPTATHEQELDRLRRDNLQIATDITDLNIVRSDLSNQIEVAGRREQKLQQTLVAARWEITQLEQRVGQMQVQATTEITSLRTELEQQDQLSTILRSKLQVLQDGSSKEGLTTPLFQAVSIAQGSMPLIKTELSRQRPSHYPEGKGHPSTLTPAPPTTSTFTPAPPTTSTLTPAPPTTSTLTPAPPTTSILTPAPPITSPFTPAPPTISGMERPNRTPSTVKKRQSNLFAARTKKLLEEESMTFKMKEHDGSTSTGSGHRRKLDFGDDKLFTSAVDPSGPPSVVTSSGPPSVVTHSTPAHHFHSPRAVKEGVWYLNTSQDELKDVALDDHVLTNTQFDLASQEGGSSQVGGASQQTVDFLFPSEDRLWYLSTSQDERRGAGSPDSRGTTPSPLAKHRGSSPHHHHYKPHGGPARLRPQKRVRFKAEDIILDAAIEGQLDVLQECVRELGSCSVSSGKGLTCLHNAAISGSLGTVRYLVEMGCDVNAQDVDGWTPLHWAAAYGHPGATKLLVQNGGALFMETSSGENALQIAEKECSDSHTQDNQDTLGYLRGVYKSMGVANKGLVFAVFTHHPECSEELGCEEGDILRVLERGGGLRGKQWWLAECGGLEGLVPCTRLGVSDRYRVAL